MKKYLVAGLLAALCSSVAPAATFTFSGTEDGGAAVSGTLNIDAALLAGTNGYTAPGTFYYFGTDDASSNVSGPFMTFSFTSAGTQPTVLSSAGYTYQSIDGDAASYLTFELDFTQDNGDGTFTNSRFGFSANGGYDTTTTDGVVLPDFASLGPISYQVQSGTNDTGAYDATSQGTITFGSPATSDVPEPASWAMMVGGFGLAGAAMRRRKAQVSFAL